ncbi:MAG: HlyD family secretion protein [Armatimonadota bacterium]
MTTPSNPNTPIHRSLDLVKPPKSGRRIAVILIFLVASVVLGLIFIPWQQTVTGYGTVSVFSAMDRPQNIEAQISGRLVAWHIQEGQTVAAGDVIAELDDIDSKFLDPEQAARIVTQLAALNEQRTRAAGRIGRLQAQLDQLTLSRDAAMDTARQRVAQSKQRYKAAQQAVIGARKTGQIAKDVVESGAAERAEQARLRVQQSEQSLTAARQELDTSRFQRERIKALYDDGLRSKRDYEIAENDFVKRKTDVERADLALKVAIRDATVGNLDKNRAGLEVDRVQTDIERAIAALDVTAKDVLTAQLDQAKVTSDTAATLDAIGATMESARESVAKIDADIQKLRIEQSNVGQRATQQVVRSPAAGRIVRLLQVGAGATVKAGDVLAVLSPDTKDRVVELMVTDNDVALLREGLPVRIQLAGWPALQFSGWPSAAIGTFAGRVTVIDALDDGTANYRVVVKPDVDAIAAKKEDPWPRADLLRPGAEATGWILLGEVSLGFELWRQFNAFPPTVERPAPSAIGGKVDKGGKAMKDKAKGDKKSPYIKLKLPK